MEIPSPSAIPTESMSRSAGKFARIGTPPNSSSQISHTLPRDANLRAAAHLFVLEPVRRSVKLADVQALGFRADGVADDDDSVAWLQRLAGHPHLHQLPSVVHLEPPLLRAAAVLADFHRHVRMRVDEVELRDDAFDGHLPAGVVQARDRMVRLGRPDRDGASPFRRRPS